MEMCEQLFSRLSKFAPITKHMNRRGFLFFKLYLLDNHNRDLELGSEEAGFHNCSGVPLVRKCGKLPIREIWQSRDRTPTARPHHRHTNAKFPVVCCEDFLARKRMATRVLRNINNLEIPGSQLRTKRDLLEIYYCNQSGSSAFRLGLIYILYKC